MKNHVEINALVDSLARWPGGRLLLTIWSDPQSGIAWAAATDIYGYSIMGETGMDAAEAVRRLSITVELEQKKRST